MAQCEEGGHRQSPERALTVGVGDGFAPRRAQAHIFDLGRQDLDASSDWVRSLSGASSTGCSLVAFQASPLTATSSERTGAMVSIRFWRMIDARLGGRGARLAATRSTRCERSSASATVFGAARSVSS
jgi:hypothetical protein